MSRRIVTGTKHKQGRLERTPQTSVTASAEQPDDFLARLAKYIPGEIVALYVAASGPIPRNDVQLQLIVLAACWIFTPIYLYFATKDPQKGPLKIQIILATIAFIVWAFALGGPFLEWDWYEQKRYVGSVILIFVTAIFGVIEPKPES